LCIWLLGLMNFQNRQWHCWQRNGRIKKTLRHFSK